MCCLFGFYNYGGKIKNLSRLTNLLAYNATERGIDASGIAYKNGNRIVIHKEAKAAYDINFKHPDNIKCVTGHTRHATQGNKNKNYNNHPFPGKCRNLNFALSHNGVIVNDDELKREYHLQRTKIATDSYAAVQMLEKRKILNLENVKFMLEQIRGGFAFSVLDSSNVLWLIRGDSPLSLVHLPNYKLYVYASTDEILYKSLVCTSLFNEIKNGNFGEIKIEEGDILRIKPDGNILKDTFNYTDYHTVHWYDYTSDYIDELRSVASYQGYSPEDIDTLLNEGVSLEDIEEYIFWME